MLRRQRTVIALLSEVGREVSHTHLVKLVFLLQQETILGSDHTFYEFVPYKYGPFSFALYRELRALERRGYIWSTERRFGVVRNAPTEELLDKVTHEERGSIRRIATTYGGLSQKSLLADVYKRFPWFATRSQRNGVQRSSVASVDPAPIAVYTTGYEGKSVDGFFDRLLRRGIQAILDVRANPVSRKYGFARRSMSEIAGKLGLRYHHLPDLGIPSSERASLSDFASYQRLLDKYEEALPTKQDSLTRLLALLQERPSALLCAEKDVRCCHRGRLAKAVAKQGALAVSHI